MHSREAVDGLGGGEGRSCVDMKEDWNRGGGKGSAQLAVRSRGEKRSRRCKCDTVVLVINLGVCRQ